MKGYLVLETGECYSGRWRGGPAKAGEIVFNTSHTGYEEIATDPSYCNQIMIMTAPMQGNYGVDGQFWESSRFWINGFISLQIQTSSRDRDWLGRLANQEVPAMDEIDTRKIVLKLRDHGTVWGAMVQATNENEAQSKAKGLIEDTKLEEKDWAFRASTEGFRDVAGENPEGPKVAVLDFGCKQNILRELIKRCSELRVFNSRTGSEEIRNWKPDGLLLSNGPGDPGDVQVAAETTAELIGEIPMFGICMGHHILARALGGRTFKLKFGHRGANHPIKDSILSKIYVTSQNHGYAVDSESLPSGVSITHTNLNDGTVAGLAYPEKSLFSVQFHPESHPGPNDAVGLFDKFMDLIADFRS